MYITKLINCKHNKRALEKYKNNVFLIIFMLLYKKCVIISYNIFKDKGIDRNEN